MGKIEDIENFKKEELNNLKKQLNQKIKMLKEEKKKKNEIAFNEFIEMKELKERAIKCLQTMPKPIKRNNIKDLVNDPLSNNIRPVFVVRQVCQCVTNNNECVGLCKQQQEEGNVNDLSESPDVSLCIAVGKALKGIDRSLFIEWADWCNQIFNKEIAITLWDYFSPRSCEVHSFSHSQVKIIYK